MKVDWGGGNAEGDQCSFPFERKPDGLFLACRAPSPTEVLSFSKAAVLQQYAWWGV